MKQKVSICDVAKIAGVSPSTVSNVINGKSEKMSEATKQKVLECLKETGYRANMIARNLVTGKSMLVGICLPLLEHGGKQAELLEDNPFYHEFIDGVQKVLFSGGYECIIRAMDDDFKYLEWIQSRSLDGLIDLGNLSNNLNEQLKELSIPTVLVDNYNATKQNIDVVLCDDEQGEYLAVKHLLELGHRRIGFVCNNITSAGVDEQRYNGYKKALKEYGIEEEYIYKTRLNYNGGLELGYSLATQGVPVSAFACTADITALGVIHGIEKAGKKVPEDFSVVGYDDLKVLNYLESRLTTVRQGVFEKGCACARLLLDKINNPDSHEGGKTVIEPKLVIRNSTRSML